MNDVVNIPIAGSVKRNCFSCPDHLLDRVNKNFIGPVRQRSRFKLTRSKLIQTFFELAIESQEQFNGEGVFDRASFKKALRKALVRSGSEHPSIAN